jgi:hypothetical protein
MEDGEVLLMRRSSFSMEEVRGKMVKYFSGGDLPFKCVD